LGQEPHAGIFKQDHPASAPRRSDRTRAGCHVCGLGFPVCACRQNREA